MLHLLSSNCEKTEICDNRISADVTGITVVDVAEFVSVGPDFEGEVGLATGMINAHWETNEGVDLAVARFKDHCETRGIRYCLERETGDPFTLMASHGRYHDVTVFGQRSLLDHGVVAQLQQLLTRLVAAGVRPIFAVSENHEPVDRVLIAYSGSMESARAMRSFLQIRPFGDVELHIVHFEEGLGSAELLMRDVGRYLSAVGIPWVSHVRKGEAREELLPFATDFTEPARPVIERATATAEHFGSD